MRSNNCVCVRFFFFLIKGTHSRTQNRTFHRFRACIINLFGYSFFLFFHFLLYVSTRVFVWWYTQQRQNNRKAKYHSILFGVMCDHFWFMSLVTRFHLFSSLFKEENEINVFKIVRWERMKKKQRVGKKIMMKKTTAFLWVIFDPFLIHFHFSFVLCCVCCSHGSCSPFIFSSTEITFIRCFWSSNKS